MVTLTIKNIPEELYERLKIQAKINHRSINKEVCTSLMGKRISKPVTELHQA